MPQDTEQVLRIIIMLSQAVVPPARDCVMLLARSSGKVMSGAARAGATAVRAGATAARNRLDGHGSIGRVRNAGSIDGPVQAIDVTGRLDDEDVKTLSRLCRRCRVGFCVTKLPMAGEDRLCLQFSARDASVMQAVLGAAVADGLVAGEDLDAAIKGPEPSASTASVAGRTWRRGADGEWTSPVESASGERLTARAAGDGRWSVEHADGTPAFVGGSPLAGRAGADIGRDAGSSMLLAGAAASTVSSERKMAVATREVTIKGSALRNMRSADVLLAAKRQMGADERKQGIKIKAERSHPRRVRA